MTTRPQDTANKHLLKSDTCGLDQDWSQAKFWMWISYLYHKWDYALWYKYSVLSWFFFSSSWHFLHIWRGSHHPWEFNFQELGHSSEQRAIQPSYGQKTMAQKQQALPTQMLNSSSKEVLALLQKDNRISNFQSHDLAMLWAKTLPHPTHHLHLRQGELPSLPFLSITPEIPTWLWTPIWLLSHCWKVSALWGGKKTKNKKKKSIKKLRVVSILAFLVPSLLGFHHISQTISFKAAFPLPFHCYKTHTWAEMSLRKCQSDFQKQPRMASSLSFTVSITKTRNTHHTQPFLVGVHLYPKSRVILNLVKF